MNETDARSAQLDKAGVAVLSLGHFVSDAYTSTVYPLLPLLAERLHLTELQVFTLAPIMAITSSLMQPVYGFLSDRYSRRIFAIMGPAVTGCFMSLIGLSPTYLVLAALLFLGGAGGGAYHPPAVALTAKSSGAYRRLGVSIFSSSGTLGFALGPLIIGLIVGATDLTKTYYTMGVGLLMTALLYKYCPPMPTATGGEGPHQSRVMSAINGLRAAGAPLLILYAISVTRSAVHMMVGYYMPFILKEQGYRVEVVGAVLTGYLLAGAIGSFVGGAAGERLSGRTMSITSGIVSAVLLCGAFVLHGPWSVVLLALGAFALMSVMSVNIAMAQELCPRDTSTVSALLMGLAWGVGSLAPSLAEPLTRVVGFQAVLAMATLLPFSTALLAFRLPVDKRPRVAVFEEVSMGASSASD